MGRTTVEIEETIRDRLQLYKSQKGMTYDEAIDQLLDSVDGPHPVKYDEVALQRGTNHIYHTSVDGGVGDLCTFKDSFLQSYSQPVLFGGIRSAISWETFRDGLKNISQYLEEGVESGTFSIKQKGNMWSGYGMNSFVTALENQDHRYSVEEITNPHHTENAVYITPAQWGYVIVSCQPETRFSSLTKIGVQFVTNGYPFSKQPYEMILNEMNLSLGNASEPRTWTTNNNFTTKVEPVNKISTKGTDDDQFVTSLQIKNPFYNNKTMLQKVTNKPKMFNDVTKCEHILLHLSDHHRIGKPRQYQTNRISLRADSGLTNGIEFINISCRGTWI